MLDEEIISMSDVEMLLMKYPNKTIKKKQVNELVNTSKTKSKKRKKKIILMYFRIILNL